MRCDGPRRADRGLHITTSSPKIREKGRSGRPDLLTSASARSAGQGRDVEDHQITRSITRSRRPSGARQRARAAGGPWSPSARRAPHRRERARDGELKPAPAGEHLHQPRLQIPSRDALITNSTCGVNASDARERVLDPESRSRIQEAVARRLPVFTFGDAMLLFKGFNANTSHTISVRGVLIRSWKWCSRSRSAWR